MFSDDSYDKWEMSRDACSRSARGMQKGACLTCFHVSMHVLRSQSGAAGDLGWTLRKRHYRKRKVSCLTYLPIPSTQGSFYSHSNVTYCILPRYPWTYLIVRWVGSSLRLSHLRAAVAISTASSPESGQCDPGKVLSRKPRKRCKYIGQVHTTPYTPDDYTRKVRAIQSHTSSTQKSTCHDAPLRNVKVINPMPFPPALAPRNGSHYIP
jgi:hypothetical protein